MRRAGKGLLSLALMDARNHTLRWMSAIEAAHPGMDAAALRYAGINPPLWSLGHQGWYQEYWVARNVQRQRGAAARPDTPRLASIEPGADALYDPRGVPADMRWQLALPDAPDIRQYLADTLETTLDLLEHAPEEDAALYFFRMALFHEDMQSEAYAEAAQVLGLDTGLMPPSPRAAHVREPMIFPAARWQLGSDTAGFAFDNEQPAHVHAVPEFEIDAQPVTWAQYCEFVEDGGYDRPDIWSSAGWAWVQRDARRTPRYVDQMRQTVLQNRFGRLVRAPMHEPAVHLSWYEADAWCRWAGRRLPTELEWELAAHTGASRGFRFGDVWEWTAGTFRPYPGFTPSPDSAYSESGFGSHRVLRGASHATCQRMRNPKFRRFLLAQQDTAFSGFRSCAL